MPRKPGTLGMTPALEQVYYLLIEFADAGEPCPSNADIAQRLKIVEDATVSQRISALRQRGFIRVSFGHWGRQIAICGTIARTSKQRRRNGPQVGHRVDSKRVKRRLAALREAPAEEDEPDEADILGMVKWGRDWEKDLDEAELWLAHAIADREESAA